MRIYQVVFIVQIDIIHNILYIYLSLSLCPSLSVYPFSHLDLFLVYLK